MRAYLYVYTWVFVQVCHYFIDTDPCIFSDEVLVEIEINRFYVQVFRKVGAYRCRWVYLCQYDLYAGRIFSFDGHEGLVAFFVIGLGRHYFVASFRAGALHLECSVSIGA